MGKPIHQKKTAGFIFLLVLLLLFQTPILASDGNVPQQVLDARGGVVRIISSGYFGAATGSGFLVGKEDKIYVVTNHHVVEDSDKLYILYDTGKYVTASIYIDDPSRDICILKPNRSIPRVEALALETEEINSGQAVFALGFPAAADYFSMDLEKSMISVDEILATVPADKKSMTITNGIISAFHTTRLVGDGKRNVSLIQTNTDINGGNSGGPLLNSSGRVVGINTMGMLEASGMNGSVHVEELLRILDREKIDYQGSPAAEIVPDPATDGKMVKDKRLWIILGVTGGILLGGLVCLLLIARRKKKAPVKGGMTLEDFEKGYRKLEELAAVEMTMRFVRELLPLAKYDLNPLMTPQNVIIGDNSIFLWQKGAERTSQPPFAYEGYTAPEILQGYATPASTVYFIGAVMYTLLTGRRPPESSRRLATNRPIFEKPGTLQQVVNRMMEPYAQNRIQDLYQLNDLLERSIETIAAEQRYLNP